MQESNAEMERTQRNAGGIEAKTAGLGEDKEMQDLNAEIQRPQRNAEGSEAKRTGTLHENQISSLIIGASLPGLRSSASLR